MNSSVRVPVLRPADVTFLAPIAMRFANLLDRSIEIVTIVSPEDDLRLEHDRFSAALSALEAQVGHPVAFRIIASDNIASALIEICRDRITVMATSASPFDETHYVGSFASALLAISEAPVILIGPNVSTNANFDPERVYVGRSRDVDDVASNAAAEAFAHHLDVPVATVTIDPKGIVYEYDYDDERIDRPNEVHASMKRQPIDPSQVAKILADYAATGLLVVSTRATQNLERICGRSVAMDTIADASSPVVAVGPHADPAFELARSN
ncbi:MAG: hypothetical protein ACI81L_003327 [Verrucomicrobiales bacterium]